MAQAVEYTLAAFRQAQLNTTLRVSASAAFLTAVASSALEEDCANAGLAEFLTTPLLASLGDKISRRTVTCACLLWIGLLRTVLQYAPSSSASSSSAFKTWVAVLVAVGKGGLLAGLKASLADFSLTQAQMSTSWIKVSLAAAMGAVLAPVFRRLVAPSSPLPLVPRLPLALLLSLGLAANVLFNAEDASPATSSSASASVQLHPVACTPLSFTRLVASQDRRVVLASLASAAAEMVRVEDLCLVGAKTEAQRVQLFVTIGIASLVGNAVAGALQSRFGLLQQARFATAAQFLSAACLVGGEPELAAALTVFAKRPSDASDVVLFEDDKKEKNEDDDANTNGVSKHHGERSGALASLKVVAQTAGSVSQALLYSSLGVEASAAFGLLCAVAGEALRGKLALAA